MAFCVFPDVRVSGICVALPTNKVSLDDIDTGMDERALKRFKKSTGIQDRYLSNGKQTTSDLCFAAADKLLTSFDVDKEAVDAVLFISQNPDYLRPSTAIILQKRLGLSKDCMAFDINLGCSGYVYGIYHAASLIVSKAATKVLLLAGDVNYDIEHEYLFGDGASATLIEAGEGNISGLLRSDGSGYKAIYTPYGGQRYPLTKDNIDSGDNKPRMNGTDVFQFSITEVPQLLDDFFSKTGTSISDYDYFVLHQANKMIIDTIARKAGLPADRVPISIDKYGNVSSASIPIAIADLFANIEEDHVKLLTSGFGVGLSWGALSFDLDRECVLEPVFTDYVWDENF